MLAISDDAAAEPKAEEKIGNAANNCIDPANYLSC